VEVAMNREKAALLSVVSNSFLITVKLVAGILMHSIGVISEAIHSSIDLIASIIAFFSIRKAAKPADDDHPFGHGRKCVWSVDLTKEALKDLTDTSLPEEELKEIEEIIKSNPEITSFHKLRTRKLPMNFPIGFQSKLLIDSQEPMSQFT